MYVIFSDLDGTLLHHQTYSFDAAGQALEAVRQQNVPLILCTSKTRAEVEIWRQRLKNNHPFIVENGGAIFIPRGCFPNPVKQAKQQDGYEVIEFGAPYAELVQVLSEVSHETRCEVLGFHDMTSTDISLRTSLPLAEAELAKQREYDEPFQIIGSGTQDLLLAIEGRGKRWTRGSRFYHITGDNDKSMAVKCLTDLYRVAFGSVRTIGVGDSHNDASLLSAVDTPIIIRSQHLTVLKRALPDAQVTSSPAPHGWNEAILPLVNNAVA
jgi:mannosyl-3-phosphoglycerate phosphatase